MAFGGNSGDGGGWPGARGLFGVAGEQGRGLGVAQDQTVQTAVLRGNGAPTNGVTGAGSVMVMGEYHDIANANIYVNTGTVASPVWKLQMREG